MAGSGRAAGRGLKERLGCGAPPGFLPTFSTFSLLKFVIFRLYNPKKGCDIFCRMLMLPFLPTREEGI